jgi:cytochrome c
LKKLFALTALSLSLISYSAHATTRDELVTFVKEAAKYAKDNGNEKAFAEFSDPTGKFNRGELYIYVYEYGADANSCINRAHGLNKGLIGRPACDVKDKSGNYPNRELMKAAKSGGGFVEFFWPHPVKKTVAKKTGYAMDLDGKNFIGSGIYEEGK